MTERTDRTMELVLQKLVELSSAVQTLNYNVENIQIALEQTNHQLSAIYDKHFPPPHEDEWSF